MVRIGQKMVHVVCERPPSDQIQSNLGKNIEINKQSHVKFWFDRKNMELSHIILAVPKSFFYGMKSDQAKSINLLLSNHFLVVISFFDVNV